MKVTEHIEHLLRQGRKPRELVELGFPKSVVTRVRRRLRGEKAATRAKIPKGATGAKKLPQPAPESTAGEASTPRKPAYHESDLQKVDNLLEVLPEVAALVAAAREFGCDRREKCPYLEDGHCVLRTWANRHEIPQGIGEPVLAQEEKPTWYVKPSCFYCAMCTALLEDRMDDVESEVSRQPTSRSQI